jgi:hypothetical protein
MQRNPYWPLNGPSFSRYLDSIIDYLLAERRGRLRFNICGADGKPAIKPFRKRESIWMTEACNHSNLLVLRLNS